MALSVGVAIHCRLGSLVGVASEGPHTKVLFNRTVPRPDGCGPVTVLQDLLGTLPPEFRKAPLRVALSAGDLSCSDAWPRPPRTDERTLERVGPALVEARTLGEELESLAVGLVLDRGVVHAAAVPRLLFRELQTAAGSAPLVLVSSIPAVLAQVFGQVSFTSAGERVECSESPVGTTWRSYRSHGPEEEGTLAFRGTQVPFPQAAAFAAAVADLDSLPNVLGALPEYRKTFARRFRDPLISIAAAATLCLGALGVHFHRDALRERAEGEAARRAELELWARFLPSEVPRAGKLLCALRERLEDLGETSGGSDFPSALGFWGEIGKEMPDPEALGLTLESLDLAPDGGRLSARLPAQKDDPLKNASTLEAKLNESPKMKARGDYEVRDGQVQVRLRMDYKP